MLFRSIIISAIAVAASFITVQAQELPEAHNSAAESSIYQLTPTSFMSRALDSARDFAALTDLQEIEQAENAYDGLANQLVDYAQGFLGTRYVWGATGPKAFDCSGFTSYIYRNIGISLNRTSRDQYTQGEKVLEVSDMQPGDLMFFSSRRSGKHQVGHVAMVVSVDPENNTCTFIHASTKNGVVYQTFPDNGYYSNHYIGARRILGTDDAN